MESEAQANDLGRDSLSKEEFGSYQTTPAGSVDFSQTKKTRKRSCATHLKRFWWVYLIIFILIILMVTLLV